MLSRRLMAAGLYSLRNFSSSSITTKRFMNRSRCIDAYLCLHFTIYKWYSMHHHGKNPEQGERAAASQENTGLPTCCHTKVRGIIRSRYFWRLSTMAWCLLLCLTSPGEKADTDTENTLELVGSIPYHGTQTASFSTKAAQGTNSTVHWGAMGTHKDTSPTRQHNSVSHCKNSGKAWCTSTVFPSELRFLLFWLKNPRPRILFILTSPNSLLFQHY